jgi:hypothetical protein
MLAPLSRDVAIPLDARTRTLDAVYQRFRSLGLRAKDPIAWRPVGVIVQMIDDVLYPIDKAVVRAIHEIDPDVVPVTVKRYYRTATGEERCYRYHAVASHHWNWDAELPAWASGVLRPIVGPLTLPPTHMDFHLEGPRRGNGLPGEYIPFDWRVYHIIRSMHQRWSDAERERYVAENSEEARAKKAVAAADARTDQRWKDDRPWLRARLESLFSQNRSDLFAATLGLTKEQLRPSVIVPGPPETWEN